MPGAADALDRARNTFGRCHHHDQIDGTDIDAELEAGWTNNGTQFSVLQTIFDFKSHTAIERSVMDFDRVRQFRELLAQTKADVFRRRTDIGKNYGRLARTNQLRQFGVEASPGVTRRWIRVAPNWRKNVHNLFLLDARFSDPAMAVFANKKSGQQIEWCSGGRKTDAAEIVFAAQHLQSLERNAEIGAAFVAGDGMQFVEKRDYVGGETLG